MLLILWSLLWHLLLLKPLVVAGVLGGAQHGAMGRFHWADDLDLDDGFDSGGDTDMSLGDDFDFMMQIEDDLNGVAPDPGAVPTHGQCRCCC